MTMPTSPYSSVRHTNHLSIIASHRPSKCIKSQSAAVIPKRNARSWDWDLSNISGDTISTMYVDGTSKKW